MNISLLEKVARLAVRGEAVDAKSDAMLNSGVISPAEHRSLKSLSWQIAANMQANGAPSTTVSIKVGPNFSWF